MNPEAVIYTLLALVVLFALAWAAKYIIDTFFPAPMHVPALLLVGVLLLILLVLTFLRLFPGVVK